MIKEKITNKTCNRYPAIIQKLERGVSDFGSIYIHVDFDQQGRADQISYSWKKDGSVIDDLLVILGDMTTEVIRGFYTSLEAGNE